MRSHILRLWLVIAAVTGVAIGLWEGAHIVRDIVYQAQGKCDYLSCTGPWTLPSLAGALVLVTAGAVLPATGTFRASGGPATAAKAEDDS